MRVYVSMPETQAKRGERQAKALGLSLAAYIRMALAERIRADEDTADKRKGIGAPGVYASAEE